MTTYAAPQTKPSAPQVGERVELARYQISCGERILYGQRIDGVVRVTDMPASSHGRAYLVHARRSPNLDRAHDRALWARGGAIAGWPRRAHHGRRFTSAVFRPR